MLRIVDFYGSTFVIFITAVFELYAFCYIYGVNRICSDIQFMLGYYPNILWKGCWIFVTPILMTAIVGYTMWSFEPPKDGDQEYPAVAHTVGWCLTVVGFIHIPIFAVYAISHQEGKNFLEVGILLHQKLS